MNTLDTAFAPAAAGWLRSQRLKTDEEGIVRNFSAGGDTESFPEKRSQVRIHDGGSFEGSGCFLAKTNLNVLTAVFYWFTLTCDEPKKSPVRMYGAFSVLSLAVPYSHMGRPHTTIGATAFHF